MSICEIATLVNNSEKDTIYRTLKSAGIKAGSLNWCDFERAKTLTLHALPMSSKQYEERIHWILDYLCL